MYDSVLEKINKNSCLKKHHSRKSKLLTYGLIIMRTNVNIHLTIARITRTMRSLKNDEVRDRLVIRLHNIVLPEIFHLTAYLKLEKDTEIYRKCEQIKSELEVIRDKNIDEIKNLRCRIVRTKRKRVKTVWKT